MTYIQRPTRFPRLRYYKSVEILLVWAYDANHGRAWHRTNRIMRRASFYEMTRAIQRAPDPQVRAMLCFLLGKKCFHRTSKRTQIVLPTLIKCLNDESAKVRCEAADAIGYTENPKAGSPLMERLEIEQAAGVRAMIAWALGAVHCDPAIPLLIQLLADNNEEMRYEAAWALGNLRAQAAVEALQQALSTETDSRTQARMTIAIQQIEATRPQHSPALGA